MGLHLVLGGARSGKSAHALAAAEAHANATGSPLLFIATAAAMDEEMALRIRRHKAERNPAWDLIEAPLDLAGALSSLGRETVVVDCLTLWLSNSMLADDGAHEARVQAALLAMANNPAEVWLVSNEVGWGVVPDNALARRFRDEAGLLHQEIAKMAAEVLLLIAGLPLSLSGGSRPSAPGLSRPELGDLIQRPPGAWRRRVARAVGGSAYARP